MAALAPELLVQLDPGRFRADNLLEAEDWDAALYGCLDDRLDHAHLFPSLDPDPMFDCALAGGGSESPPDPPWHQESPGGCPDLQVKSEPNSPTSSHCSDSSCSSEPQIWAPKSPEMGVKVESPPPLPCAPQESAQPPQGMKSEFSPQNCRGNFLETPKSPLGAPKSPQSRRGNPKIHPKIAQSPQKTFVLQTLPGNPQGGIAVPTPAVLLPGGLLCLTPPGPPKATIVPRVTTLTTALTTTLTTGSTGSTGNAAGNSQVDVKALRRQQRMIKNRESASLSRRRRKEYVQSLEQKLRLALAENERLRRDNGALRRRLQELSGQPSPGPTPRTLACLGIFLLLTFHLRPLSLPQATPTEPPPAAPPPPRRHLLGIPEVTKTTPEIWGPRPEPLPHSFRNSTLTSPWVKNPKFLGTPDCRSFNRTESLRLADELRGWVRRHQKIHRGNPGEKHLSDQAFPSWKAPGGTRIVPAVPPRAERAPPGQLQLYRSPDPPEPRILAAIDRRDDTFYVVSFRRDHLLLPARSHNKTSRPKMSLVMPAAALNDSLTGSGRGLQAMMQVDCEVMNTRVIHVRRRRAPPPSRPSPTRKPRSLVLGGASP